MIRATFSAETNSVNVALPKGWGELTQFELMQIHQIIDASAGEDARFDVFRRLANFKVTRQPPMGGKFKCIMDVNAENGGPKRCVFWLEGIDIVEWLDELNWIYEPGSVPNRMILLRHCAALDENLYGVDFGSYLMIENYYQGFLKSQNPKAITSLYKILYPSEKQKWENLQGWEISNILTWVAQVKNLFAKKFPNLFKPGGKGSTPSMLDIMNNEIRILTGGDVTKEAEVKAVDCWRALTELDFKAKDAEDFRRQQAKLKH